MAVNKVDVNGVTVLDLTQDSVTPATLKKGETAHDASGAAIVGEMESSAPSLQSKSVTYTSNGTNTITPDAPYDGLSSVDVTVNVSGLGDIDGNNTTYGLDSPYFRLSNCKMKNFLFRDLDSSFDLSRNVTLENFNFGGGSVTFSNSGLENVELRNVVFIRCSVTCSQTFYDAFLAGGNYSEDTNFNIVE